MRMLGKFAERLTYANVVATLALFVALGGASYAAVKLPRNSVGSAQLKHGAVTLSKVSKGAQKSLKGAQGAQGLPGAPGVQGLPGGTGPSDAYVASDSVDSLQSGQSADLARTPDLPAGHYAVSASAQLTNTDGALQNIHCRIMDLTVSGGSGFVAGSSTVYGAVGADASISLTDQVEESDGQHHLLVRCSNDGTSGGGVSIYVAINAVKVGEFHRLPD